jgi:hypothetical protein
VDLIDAKTAMTHAGARQFTRNHLEEFVNKNNVQIGNLNFAPDFLDHAADVPPGMPPGTSEGDSICGRCTEAISRSACAN